MEPFDLDLLQEGGWSDVLWSLKRYAPDGYKFAVKRTPHEIKSDVLNSRRVQHAIQKVIMISVLILRHKKPCRLSIYYSVTAVLLGEGQKTDYFSVYVVMKLSLGYGFWLKILIKYCILDV